MGYPESEAASPLLSPIRTSLLKKLLEVYKSLLCNKLGFIFLLTLGELLIIVLNTCLIFLYIMQ